jgi:hypothetical protein
MLRLSNSELTLNLRLSYLFTDPSGAFKAFSVYWVSTLALTSWLPKYHCFDILTAWKQGPTGEVGQINRSTL